MTACRDIHRDEVQRVLDAFSGPYGARNRCLFARGCMTGFRVSELLSIHRGQVLTLDGQVCVELTIERRNLKGTRRSRTAILNDIARTYLLELLAVSDEYGYILTSDIPENVSGSVRSTQYYETDIRQVEEVQSLRLKRGSGLDSCQNPPAGKPSNKYVPGEFDGHLNLTDAMQDELHIIKSVQFSDKHR